MQYWIFYEPTTGGRNLARLLENTDNIYAADGYTGFRPFANPDSPYSESVAQYGAAQWATINGVGCSPFIDSVDITHPNLTLNPIYENLIDTDRNTVILSHYGYFEEIENFAFRNTVEKNQVKINLYMDEQEDYYAFQIYWRQQYRLYLKNLSSGVDSNNVKTMIEFADELGTVSMQSWVEQFKTRSLFYKNSTQFDLQLDVDLCFNHFYYLQSQLRTVGIEINEEKFELWRTVQR